MSRTRKRLTLLVTVSVPAGMPAADARREVKDLITHQRNWRADLGDVKAIVVHPKPKDRIPDLAAEIKDLRWQLGRGPKPKETAR